MLLFYIKQNLDKTNIPTLKIKVKNLSKIQALLRFDWVNPISRIKSNICRFGEELQNIFWFISLSFNFASASQRINITADMLTCV